MKNRIELDLLLCELESESQYWTISGGTVSSRGLREALRVEREYGKSARLSKIIEDWRAALRIHNAQPRKSVEYNIETGEPIK